ncbi:MAG: hypothetical protein AAGG07_11155 [Planctomycetota bacterium]
MTEHRSHRMENGPLAGFRKDLPAPDLTDLVLDRVDAARPFISKRQRITVLLGRAGLGLAAVALTLGSLATYRALPSWVVPSERTPLTTVVDAGQASVEAGRILLDGVFLPDALEQHAAAAGLPGASFDAGFDLNLGRPDFSTYRAVTVGYSSPEPAAGSADAFWASYSEDADAAEPEFERSFGLPGDEAP